MNVCSLPIVQWRDEQELREAVKTWATKMGVQVPQIHVRPLKSKWGSISTKGAHDSQCTAFRTAKRARQICHRA